MRDLHGLFIMNIFYLHPDPVECAKMHNDKHCVKMIVEYSQLMSTAHRVIDGKQSRMMSDSGRMMTRYVLPDHREQILYKATHMNHPSAVWCRYSNTNYEFLSLLLMALTEEYTHRYGRVHKVESSGLLEELLVLPDNIYSGPFTEPTPAMPTQYIIPGNSVKSYHRYYIGEKKGFSSWKNREVPQWFKDSLPA